MAEYELVQDRSISGKGVLQIPNDVIKNRALILYTDVFRKPKNLYINNNYNPSRGRYGTVNFFRNGYLIKSDAIEYPKQSWDTINDICGQTLIALKCAYEGILQSYQNLGLALGVTPTVVTDLIKDYENLGNNWDEIKIVCYADTAIQARLFRLKYDTCNPDKDKERKPPPPPPPRPNVPPGTPLDDLSDPYEGDDDGGDTEYYAGDSNPPAPEDTPCQKVRVTYRYDLKNLATNALTPRERYADMWAVIGDISTEIITGGGSKVKIQCQGVIKIYDGVTNGIIVDRNDPCGTFRAIVVDEESLGSSLFVPVNEQIVNIVPA